jgi:hypothetical protein
MAEVRVRLRIDAAMLDPPPRVRTRGTEHEPSVTGRKAQNREFEADAFATEIFTRAPRSLLEDMFPLEVALPLLFDILEAAERRLPAVHRIRRIPRQCNEGNACAI